MEIWVRAVSLTVKGEFLRNSLVGKKSRIQGFVFGIYCGQEIGADPYHSE